MVPACIIAAHTIVPCSSLPEEHLSDDLCQLSLLLGRPDVTLGLTHFKQRFSWLMANTYLLQEQHDSAVLHLYQVNLSLTVLCMSNPAIIFLYWMLSYFSCHNSLLFSHFVMLYAV